ALSIRCYVLFYLLIRAAPVSTLFPYTTLFRSRHGYVRVFAHRGFTSSTRTAHRASVRRRGSRCARTALRESASWRPRSAGGRRRSEEHTSELQSRENLVCRLLLEKKKKHETSY